MNALARRQEKIFRKLTPRTARLVTVNGERNIIAERIWVGDVLRILPGEVVPADGIIIAGDAMLDQSVMTGDAAPESRKTGDAVFSGSVNRGDVFDIRVVREAGDSFLQRTVRMVLKAEASGKRTSLFRDRKRPEIRPAF